MAIPFTIPDQEVSQSNIEELLRELCDILQRLLIIYQSPANTQTSRNRATAGRRVRTSDQDRIPELVTNLSLLSAAFNTRTELDAVVPVQNFCTPRHHRRQRTNSESSCCDESKPNVATVVITPNQDWIQVGLELRKIGDDFKTTRYKDDVVNEQASPSSSTRQDSLFSKLVPAPFTGSICTAVICVVGWHLLRNR